MRKSSYVVLFGPPGSGKGTQSQMLAEKLSLPRLVAGDILREEKASGSALGQKIASIIDRGHFVPATMIVGMIKDRLTPKGAVLDGFPRTVEQAVLFGGQADHVIFLDVPDNVVRSRLLSRGSGRADEDPEVIEERIKVYHDISEPLIEFYRPRGLLRTVDGTQSIEKVHNDILKIVMPL